MLSRLLRWLDTESVTTFQVMYYLLFTALAVNLLIPGMPVQDTADAIDPTLYPSWITLNLACPPMALLGRWLTGRAASAPEGAPNSSVGGAWLQFAGDLGVWGSVNLRLAAMLSTDWWTHNLYVLYFVLMGVLGGGMFTLRSLRRLLQIRRVTE